MKRFSVAILVFCAVQAYAAPQAMPDKYQTKINNQLSRPAPGVLQNDSDAESAELVSAPNHGKVKLNADGSFVYTPFADFVGNDEFHYRAVDGNFVSPGIVQIQVYATGRASLSAPSTICKGETTAVVVDLTGDAPFMVKWADGVTQNGSGSRITRTVQPEKSTFYSVANFTDENGPGPVTPSGVLVRVEDRPPTPAITGSGAPEVGESLMLSASGNFTTYQWFRNGVAIPGANTRGYVVSSANAATNGLYTVTGSYGQCPSLPSPPVEVEVAGRRVIPVIGSAVGAFDSTFRSSIQVYNRADSKIDGSFNFYGNTPGAPAKSAFEAGPRATVAFHDVASLFGANAVGSVDIGVTNGPVVPYSVVRVYNDNGPRGTTGAIVPQVRLSEVLRVGDAGIVISPANVIDYRFNIGIRTMAAGVTFNLRSYGADGQLRMLVQRSFPGNSFRQLRANDLLGIPLTSSETLRFEIVSGAAVIYGTSVENRTNDPVIQVAEKIGPQTQQAQKMELIIPAAASQIGNFGSWFRTAVQVHNPGSTPLSLTFGFRPALQIAGKATHTRLYKVEPFGTIAIDDLLPALGTQGFGSIDVTATGNIRPVFQTRVYNEGIVGETGTTELVLSEEEVPRAGDRIVLIAPTSPGTLRFNVGIRTLEEGATIVYTVRSAAGQVRKTGVREFPTSYLLQQSAADFFGITPEASDSIEVQIAQGAAVLYGSVTDNLTQDPAMQMVKR